MSDTPAVQGAKPFHDQLFEMVEKVCEQEELSAVVKMKFDIHLTHILRNHVREQFGIADHKHLARSQWTGSSPFTTAEEEIEHEMRMGERRKSWSSGSKEDPET